jgi:hypothetical protein
VFPSNEILPHQDKDPFWPVRLAIESGLLGKFDVIESFGRQLFPSRAGMGSCVVRVADRSHTDWEKTDLPVGIPCVFAVIRGFVRC